MNKKKLKFILQEGEGQFIEFKEKLDKKAAQEIVAFANASGGRIFLGIDDQNNIKGINIINKLKSQVQDIARNCDPSIAVKLESFENILIINIAEGKNKPYSCSDGFYMRMNANSQKMNRDQIIELSIKSGKIRFDEQICSDFKFEDFDDEKFNYYLKLARISDNLGRKDILKNLKVLPKKGMTNAGVLFFAKEPYKYIGNSKIRCVRFKGNERVNIIDKKEVDKGVIGNIEFAIQYLNECVPVRFEIIGSKRKEYPQFPEKAYREAIVNAVVHRDYIDNGEVAVEKLKDELIINNPGNSLVSKREFGTTSRLRNRLIADLLSRTVFMEKVGTGIKRIKTNCEKNKNKVEFKLAKNDFFVILKSKPLNGVEKETSKLSQVDEWLTQVNARLTQELSDNEKKIIFFMIKNNKINSTDLQNLLKISRVMANRHFNRLIEKKLIMRKGSGKSTYYVLIEVEKDV
ncbi:MAG: putative DNA binding domain-containing protein [Nanoarchaeota archaeon]|nr:putative DNA binding domain-containing protein [Nanoarchaeota archaeon]